MSNARKPRIKNPGTSRFSRNRREWAGQPGNRLTQERMAQQLRDEAEARKKPRFILQPKTRTVDPTLLPATEEQSDALEL